VGWVSLPLLLTDRILRHSDYLQAAVVEELLTRLTTTTVQTVVLEVEELTLSEPREPVSQDKVLMAEVLSTTRTRTEVLVVVVVPVVPVVPVVR
jgi:hypothetical protein